MALAPLATVDDLATLGIDVPDVDVATSLLESVSESVREAAGVPITRTVSTVALETEPSRRIVLPGGPVRSVTSVKRDGVTLTEGEDYVVRSGALWSLAARWRYHNEVPDELTVTYEHGYDKVPADVVRTVCLYVAAGLAASEEGFEGHRGKQYVSIDDYREGYLAGKDEVVDPTELTERTRRLLRARFGGDGPIIYKAVQ